MIFGRLKISKWIEISLCIPAWRQALPCIPLAVICLFLLAHPRLAEAASQAGECHIFPLGAEMHRGLSVRDVAYPQEAAGFDQSGVYQGRKKAVTEGSSFLQMKNGLLEVESQVWKEAAPSPFYAYYQNTAEFYCRKDNGDYKIEVVLANPSRKAYSAFLRSGNQEQSWTKRIPPGKEAVLNGTISVVEGELSFSVLASGAASSPETAEKKKVYIKEIRVRKLPREEVGESPTIFFAGDSTSAYYGEDKTPWEGWGQEFYQYFGKKDTVSQESFLELGFRSGYLMGYREYKMSDIVIEDWSVPGETTKTFLESGKWDGILNKARPGDYVFVQFGHNDSDKTKGIKYVSLADYEKNLETFARGCAQRGVRCVFFSPVASCVFDSQGVCRPWVNSYREAMAAVAGKQNVSFIDMGLATADFLTQIGEEKARSYYLILPKGQYDFFPEGRNDTLHLRKEGAVKFAQIAAALLVESQEFPALASFMDVDTDY